MQRSASWIIRFALFMGLLSVCACGSNVRADEKSASGDSPQSRFFENKVRPLLAQHCFACHSEGAKALKGGLRLEHREGLFAGGDSGQVVVPGNAKESRLIQAVRYNDPELRMPPAKRLSETDIDILETWVNDGAHFPKSAGVSDQDRKSHWSLTPPISSPAPAVKQRSWVQNPIDQFVLARMEAKGMSPASAADKYTLIRRVTYDVTGLPATADEVTAFLNDDSPSAFETVVDRLLASPRYGERWGRHWLDLVRYADDFEDAWRYRDWVIRAANQDLGYDQFIIHQVAGDLLPVPAGQPINADGIIATTMLALGPWGGIDRKKRLADIVDDQIDIIGRSFLGMTLACARCHDHKFDPITAQDYYALAGMFYSSHIISDAGYLSHGTKRLRIPLAALDEVKRHEQQSEEIRRLESKLTAAVEQRYGDFARSLIPQTWAYLEAAYDYAFWPKDLPKPAMNQFAAQRSLHAFAIERWIEYLKGKPLSSFRLLDHAVADYDGEKGVNVWRSHAERPWWGVNTNQYDVPIETFNLPPRTVSYYPSVEGGSVVWKSPIAGRIRVAGRLVDADPLDGVGVAWLIDRVSQGARTELSNGAMPATGSMLLSEGRIAQALTSIAVNVGDTIEFQAWLSRGDAHYDVTNVELTITDLATGATWDLVHDVMDHLLQGNPQADSLGNASVWSFLDLDGSHRKHRMPAIDQNLAISNGLSIESGSNTPDGDAFKAAARRFQTVIDAAGADSPIHRDLAGIRSPFWVQQRNDAQYLSAESQAALAKDASELAAFKASVKPLAYAHGVQEGGLKFSLFPRIQDARMHARGSPEQLGDVIVRRLPVALNVGGASVTVSGSGRGDLARWLASPDNPLTARVIVNRIWQDLFGEGIVRTSSNFGALGEAPTHPELLDWMAVRLMTSNWSIKDLTRLIVTSATYQQSNQAAADQYRSDAENALLGRMNRRRLDAEAIRDSLLAVSGRLDERLGGPPEDRNRPRRMMYLKSLRSDKSGFGTLFDAADPAMHVEKRTSTTVAPQALELMNSPLLMELATELTRGWTVSSGPETAASIRELYRKVYGRVATPDEISIGIEFLSRFAAVAANKQSTGSECSAWEAYAQALLLSNGFLYVD